MVGYGYFVKGIFLAFGLYYFGIEEIGYFFYYRIYRCIGFLGVEYVCCRLMGLGWYWGSL